MQGHEKLDTPLDVLDALEACAAKGAARALCALAAASFRAATLLGMTCEEAASLGPCQSLQVLLMKGPQAAPVSPFLLKDLSLPKVLPMEACCSCKRLSCRGRCRSPKCS